MTSSSDTQYAGFWPRLGAQLADTLLVVPLLMLGSSVLFHHRTVALILWLPWGTVGVAYELLFLSLRGGTPGKMLAGVRVVKLSGDSIGWQEALMRCSVAIVTNLGAGVASLMALTRLPPPAWSSGVFNVFHQLKALEPAWGGWLSGASQVWMYSELFVLLLNKRRRALHDFMAGTIVVREPSKERGVR